ncbi:MAG: efflux RND transporter permease subunit [Thermodesulfobacteriota bacterium]
MEKTGIAGRIAGAFIRSKLTPLIIAASLLLGGFAVLVTPREEEPQINVPMIDVFVGYPGASAKEVEERVTTPMEKLIHEIKGVEYIYSMARPGGNLTIVRFYVGSDVEESIVKLYDKLMSNYDRIPPGVSRPLVKPRSIDDVPILSLTLWSERYTGFELRKVGLHLAEEIKKDADISATTVTGGQRRQVRIDLDPARLRAYSASAFGIMGALQKANYNIRSGSFPSGNTEYLVETGGFLKDADDVGAVVVGVKEGRPVFLRDVAEVTDGPEEPSDYVFMGLGPAAGEKGIDAGGKAGLYEAVTVSVAKKQGANASVAAARAIRKAETLTGGLVPRGVNLTVTRNYGETAKDKSDELLKHMLIATVAVICLIALALGWRESIVVAVAVPVTLALTLLVNYLYGYTLNRVTLFALIFSIGILVDDAIVVVENIYRHFQMKGPSVATAIKAVDEVGNPTILATFTVIAALLPMAFVSGLMGPYMRPIPVGASAAMIFSLLIAFIASPYLGFRVLKNVRHTAGGPGPSRLFRAYSRAMAALIESRAKRAAVFAGVALLLLLVLMLVPFKAVKVKMLPFDNKSEMQIIIDTPEGTTLETTALLARRLGEYLRTVDEVTDFQSYIGTSGPFNFNGLVRHYYLRSGSNVADIQVNLVDKRSRSAQSHEIARRLRPELKRIGDGFGASIKVAEIPPGPPVLSTLVAEVYGPDPKGRIETARRIKEVFETTGGVVDVDWYVEDDQKKFVFEVDKEKAALAGISTEAVSRSLRISLAGMGAGLLHDESSREPVELFLRMPMQDRANLESLGTVGVPSASGELVPLSELVTVRESTLEKTIYHKNMKDVVYVTADVAGEAESPVYAILGMRERIKKLKGPDGHGIEQFTAHQPWLEEAYSMKWDGEWHITYEVFRDLGVAFAAVLVLIYILVVAWFGSFITPAIIMAPIPLTLVGILPGHWLFDAFFTATSMIGFIALAGIIVRNSILLVDFIELERSNGAPLKEAVIKAGAVRFRPILLTALAVVVGSFVMLFDPIFQGLAISMIFGAVAATGLTLVAVPLLYYQVFRRRPSGDDKAGE